MELNDRSENMDLQTRMRRYLQCAGGETTESSHLPARKAAPKEQAPKRISVQIFKKRPEDVKAIPSRSLPDAVVENIFQVLKDGHDMRALRTTILVSRQFARIGTSLLPHRPACPSIPDEILLDIFSAVRFNTKSNDPSGDLASCLQVSQQWYRTGMPLLYKNSVMDVNYRVALQPGERSYSSTYFPIAKDRYDFIPSARFYDTATKLWSQPWTDTGIGAWIQSLSVEIHFSESQINQKHKQSITDIIKDLPNIRTFSIRAAPLRQDNYILRGKFMDLLTNMPSNIVNFELDLQSRDSSYENPLALNNICVALARLVPQLHTLRLRLATMCSAFLHTLLKPKPSQVNKYETVYSGLRALSISLYTRDFTQPHQCCMHSIASPPGSPHVKFMDALQEHITEGVAFPSLNACALVCLRHDSGAPTTLAERLVCKNFDPRMRTWSKRAFIPVVEGFTQPWYVQTDEGGDELERIIQGLTDHNFVISGFPEDLKLKHGKTTDALFESDAAWMEDALGARYPPCV